MGFNEYFMITYDKIYFILINHYVLLLISIIVWVTLNNLKRRVDYVRDFSSIPDTRVGYDPVYPSFPNGWIGVCESQHLKDHQIKRIDFCGHRIILLRSSSTRKPYALDAYCPHLGADLSVGGKIVNNNNCQSDCVRCPFHGWSFRASDGQCVDVPYTKDRKPPNGVKIKSWECLETNGSIYVWHHTEGLKSTWTPPEIEEITTNQWKYMGRTEHIVNCLLQEIPENGPDFAHLDVIHGPSFLWGGKIKENNNILIDSITHHWESSWDKNESSDGHIATLTLKSMVYFVGFKLSELQFDRLEQIGPTIVNLYFDFKFLGMRLDGVYVQNITPLLIKRQKIIHHLYMRSSWVSPLVAQFLLRVAAIMFERDIQVWSNKMYLTNPKLVKEEKQIQMFRRWYSQFFTKRPENNYKDIENL